MADEEDPSFEELEEPDELDEEDVEDLVDDDEELADDPVLDPLADDPELDPLVDDAVAVEPDDAVATPEVVAEEDEDDEEEDDEDPDDVEAGLDVILKDRLVVPEDESDEDEEVPDAEERVDGVAKALVKRPGEFTCQSCFLVKHPGQLADATRMLCRDCV
jgi:Domain of unknown function (DUF4193)